MKNNPSTSRHSSRKSLGITPSFIASLSRKLALATLAALGIGGTEAATVFWDPLVDGNGILGGTGNWTTNPGNLFWDPTGTDPALADNVVWPNTAADVAVFGGTAGTVTINNGGLGVIANGLTFNSNGYVINSQVPGDTLTLAGLTPTISVTNAAHTATINSIIAGSAGLTVSGAGTLLLTGANTFTGGTTIASGTLAVNVATATNPLSTGTITLAGGTLQLNPTANTSTTGISGRQVTGAIDTTTNFFYGATATTRVDPGLNRADFTTAGTGTPLSPTTAVGVQWLGKLQITNAGGYRFFTASDDGSRIFIDGVLVVNNDGPKGTTDLGSRVINLTAGLHDIRVDFAQNGGGAGEILSWAAATPGLDTGLTETPIPASALFTAESNTTTGASNAVVLGNAMAVTANSTIRLNGTNFTQAQLDAYTHNSGTTLNVTGSAGKTLRFGGAANFGGGVAGTVTINNVPDVAFDGVATDGGLAVTIAKQGAGRLIFDQTAAANTLGATSLVDVQNGTLVLVGGTGAAGVNDPIGTAGIQLSGGGLVLDSKVGGPTFDNAVTVTANGTIQSIVNNQTVTVGSATRGVSLVGGSTLTMDAITGGNSTANNPTGTGFAGATLQFNGPITGTGNLSAISTSYGNNTTPGVIVLNNAGNTFAGTITLNGSTITTNTVLPVNGPTLTINVAGALPNGATNAIFVKSGTLNMNNTNYTAGAAVTMGGGPAYTTSTINAGTGTFSLTGDVIYDATNNGGAATIASSNTSSLDMNTAGMRTFNVGDSANAAIDLIVTARVSATGGGGLLKTGPGTMALAAGTAGQATPYNGLTQISQGTLFVGGGAGFGGDAALTGPVQIDAGATYKPGQSNIINNSVPFTVNGTLDMNGFTDVFGSASGNGVITASVSNATTGSGGFANFDFPTNTFSFSGTLTGELMLGLGGRLATAPVTVTTGQFAAMTYRGDTIVGDVNANSVGGNTVTLALSSNNALPFGFSKGNLQVQGSTGAASTNKGVFDLAGFNQTINGLIGTTGVQIPLVTNSGATDSTLTIGGANAGGTFNGVIQDGATNKVNIVKTGLGTEILGGVNTYTGVTTVNNGQLNVANASGLGSTLAGTVVNSGGYVGIANVAVGESFTLSGNGQPLALTTVNNYSLQSSGALLATTGFTGAVNGTVTLAGDASIGAVGGAMLTINGAIGESTPGSSLSKVQGNNAALIGTLVAAGGPGIVRLTGASTYTGATIIRDGDLQLANNAGQAIVSQNIIIGDGTADAAFTMANTALTQQQFPSNAILNFSGAGKNAKFQLNGTTQTVAGFVTNGGSLPIIQNHENAAPGAGTLIVNNAADTTFDGLIRDQSNTLAVTKQGTGTLTFDGNSRFGTGGAIYTGLTTVSNGKLVLKDETGFNSPITITGTGTLEFNTTFGRVPVYAKALTDNGLGFTKSGPGGLTINTVGAVSGTVNVTGGTLDLTDATGNVNPLPGASFNVSAGAQLQFFGVSGVTTTFNNNITLNGMTPGGAFSGAVIGGTPVNTLTGTLTLNATSNISTGWNDKTINFQGLITGSGGLVIDKLMYTQNPPIVNITNTTNNYAGGTTINSGTVAFATGALPATGNLKFGGTFGNGGNVGVGQLTLGTGGLTGFTRNVGTGAGEVQFTGDGGGFTAIGSVQTVTFGNVGPIDWSGTGTTGMDANSSLVFNTGNGANNEVNVTNDINLNGGTRRVVVGANQARFSGALSGTGGLIIDGGATLFMSGAGSNTYTGVTNLSSITINLAKTGGATAIAGDLHLGRLVGNGIAILGASEQIADTSVLTFTGQNANNGFFRMGGFTETVAGIMDRSGGGVVENSTGGTGTLIVNNTSDFFFNGFFRNTTGTLALQKNGAGTLTISAGQQSGTGNASYSGATAINAGKLVYNNLTAFNSVPTIAGGATLEFSENINQTATFGQIIGGAGNVAKSGLGTAVLSVVNNYSGTTTVNGGTLQITNTQGAGHTGGYVVNGGTLLIGNGGAGALTNNNAIATSAGGTVAFNRNNGYTYSGVISGGGNVESRSGGTATILSGANTYSGTTTVLASSGLQLGGSGASAGGLIVNAGGTLTLGFGLAGSNPGGIVAATAPVTLNGGTLSITATGPVSQSFGPITIGPGVSNFISTGGSLTLSMGTFSHATGGAIVLSPVSVVAATTTSPSIGGILSGYAVDGTFTNWLGLSGGILGVPVTYGTDTYGAGVNTDVIAGGAGASTNSIRFNNAGVATVTFTGTNTINSGGILVTPTVGGNANTLTGGIIRGSATDGLTINQFNTGSLTIASVIADNGGPTGLTKTGTGTTTLTGANTYTGATVVAQGTLVSTGSLGSGPATALVNTTLQIGDGVTNGVMPTFGTNVGTVVINNATAVTMPAFNADGAIYNYSSNPNSLQSSSTTGTFQKLGAGTLTITNALLTNQFHPRTATTVIDTGGNVVNSNFSSIGLANTDNAILTLKGLGKYTVSGDLNVSDQNSSRGTMNIQDQAAVVAGNLFVGKTGTSVGVVNQTFGALTNTGGGNDWRIGGNATAGSDTGAYGAYNISAGNFQTARNFQIGASGLGIFNQTGGTVNVTGGFHVVGRFAGIGELNISNGTSTNTTGNRMIIAENGTGYLNVGNGGQLIFTATAAGSGLGIGSNNAGAGNGIVNLLAGGTIITPQVVDQNTNPADGSSIFNFNGGTLRVTTGSVSGATFMTGLTSSVIYSGGATIDTNGVATTIGQVLAGPLDQGVSTIGVGAGGSGYVGEPLVTLTGGVGTGATARAIVSGGAVTGFTITSPGSGYTPADVLTVNISGGGGTGATGTVTLAPNANTGGLTKQNAGVLTLTNAATYGGSTTIAGGSINAQFGSVGATNILPATALTLSGGGLAATGFAAGANTQTFTGTTLSGVGTVTSTSGAGGTMVLDLGAINRTTGGAADFSANGVGVINTLTANTGTTILGGWATFGGGANWAQSAGTGVVTGPITAMTTYTANTWAAGNNTDVTTAGTITNLTTNSVRFSTATPQTITVSGTDVITTGGILITPTATAAATIFTGGTLNSGGAGVDLVVNHFGTNTATLTSAIGAATGGLVKAGGGVLILSSPTGTNVYTGSTTVGAGTLRLGVTEQIPNNSNLTVGGGATFDLNNLAETINGLSGYGTIVQANTPTDNTTTTATFTVGSGGANSTFTGVINNTTAATNRIGNVALTKTGAGTLTLNAPTTWSNTGATTISAGAIKLASPTILQNSASITVNAVNGLLFDTTIPQIGGLNGNQAFALQTTGTAPVPNAPVQLTIGNNNNGGTFSAALTGSGTLIKIGNGAQTLSGANTNQGGFIVTAGSLLLSGNNGAAGGLMVVNTAGTVQFAAPNSLYAGSGRNLLIGGGGVAALSTVTANPTSVGFPSITSALSRIDQGSTGVLAVQSDSSLQTLISENLDFSAQNLNVSLGATNSATGGLGTAPAIYTGIITPNGNTYRLGGGNGRLTLPNSATLAGTNNVSLWGGGGTGGGQLFLTGNYTYTGYTIVNNGTTYVTNLANGGQPSSVGAASSAASNLVLNGGILSYIGNGSSTDRLFSLTGTNTTLDASGSGPVNFANTGAIATLSTTGRTLTLQGTNTGANTIASAIGDTVNQVGANGTVGSGVTTLVKNGNGTWVLSGNNTFSGGATVNNGVLMFDNASAIGGFTVNGPGSVLVNAGGAAAFGSSFTGSVQAALQRISPLSAGSVALTADTSQNLNFDGGSTGATLPLAFLGAYGNVTYTGTLTPFGNTYRLGGGGGVLTMPNGGLTGPRIVVVGGGGPGTSFANNPNLSGNVVLGGTSDYSGGTILNTGGIVSATSLTALGAGPLKFQGGFYRAVDATDITLASDGVTAREIRIGGDGSGLAGTANVDVVGGVSVNFSKSFGPAPTLGSNLGQQNMTKWGAGTLTLANSVYLGTSNGSNNVASNTGTLIIERGTLSFGANPTNYAGNISVGSNNGGVGSLKLAANDVFANTPAKYNGGFNVDLYAGSTIDLAGFSDSFRVVRGTGTIINSGGASANLTTGINNDVNILAGNLKGNFTLTRGGTITNLFGTGAAINSTELWNAYSPDFTGRLVINGGAIRLRADGTIGSTAEPFKADKITINNNATLLTTGNAVALGANHGITLGAGGGTIWAFGTNPFVINGPISGSGRLTIADDAGAVFAASDSNTWAGGTIINSNAAGRGILVIGAGGATGSLPAGDVFFNSGAGLGRLIFFKSTDMTVSNNLNGPGQVLQIGAGTTTLTGTSNTGQSTFVGGGKLRVDFTNPANAPIGTGTGLQVSGGTFEYLAPAGSNTLRLGTLTPAPSGNNGLFAAAMVGGGLGDSVIQSTYGGSGNQTLMFGNLTGRVAGVTTTFVTSGGTNGVTNSIRFSGGATGNTVIGGAFYSGGDLAAYDINGFVRAAIYGADTNTAPLNTLITSRYSKLTTSLINQGPVQPSGIVFAAPNANLAFASSGNTATPFTVTGNPAVLLKTGGGGAAGVSVISGGTMALNITTGTTTPITLSNNNQELIVRAETAADFLQIDLPIVGTGGLTKSGLGQVTLTAPNVFTGVTLASQGTILLTGNGTLGTAATPTGEVRLGTAAGQSVTLNIDSATAGVTLATGANAFRVGEGGTATVNQSNGTVNVANYLALGDSFGTVGTYNITGGTLNVKTNAAGQGNLVVGRIGQGTLSIGPGATVNMLNGGQVMLGMGTLNSTQFQGMTANVAASTGVGTITQTGGNVNVTVNNGTYNSNFVGGVIIGVDGAGTYTLNGGTLTTPIFARGHGSATFNLGGGTLKAATPVATLPASLFNVDLPVNLTGTGAGKGTIDTNGSDASLTGPLSGAGGLAKGGAGTLNVLGAGSYAGGTDINAGKVVASGGSLGTGVVNVGPGATLQVQGVQQGLLAKFYLANRTEITPGNTAANVAMYAQFANLETFNEFVSGKPLIAAESTAARGKTSVDYLDLGGAGQISAMPPALIQLQGGDDPFMASLSGKFNATTTGDYTFQTRSDDASMVWVDGNPVLDNNRAQGQTVRTGTISLSAGLHDIVIAYGQGTGGGGFSVGVTQAARGQSYLVGAELNMSNALLSYGSDDLTVGGLSGSGSVQLSTGDLTLNGASGTNTFSGVITGIATSGLVKDGDSTQILSGDSSATFSGTTAVLDGSLLVNGNLSGSAATVALGGLMGGTGTTGAIVVFTGSVLAPGSNGVGTLNTLGNVTLNSGSQFALELGAVTVGGYDRLNVTGSISLAGSASIQLTGAFADHIGDTFFVMLNDGADPVTGTFSNAPGNSITLPDGHVFSVNYAANGDGGGTPNDVSLTLTAVPEPGSAAMLLGGLALLAGGRRIRRRS
jgi:autotransporter-associated beta strand protein